MKNKSFSELIKFLLANITLILAIVLIVFTVLDRFNPMMGFVSSAFSQALLITFMICAALLAITVIIGSCKNNKKQ